MTFPVPAFEADSSEPVNTTTHTVDMPAGSGGVLVAAILFDARPISSGQIVDDWTHQISQADGGDHQFLRVFTKVANGTEGATQTILTDVGQTSAHHVWRVTGAAAAAFMASIGTEPGGASATCDPAALNPAGWDVEDTLWLTLVGIDNGTTTISAYPASYDRTGLVNAGDATDGVSLAWALRDNAVASEDPGAFTLDASQFYCTVTLAIRPALPVGHLATGAKATTGTTTQNVAYPAGVAAGVLAIACRNAWMNLATIAAESGWTDHTDLLGGLVGTNIADSHQGRVAVDLRELDGSESGSVTFDQVPGTNGGVIGLMVLYAKSPTAAWDTAIVTGDDALHGVNRAATASAAVDLQPGDVVVAVAAVDTDLNLAGFATPAITASGITFGTTTRRTTGAGAGTGNDGNVEVFDAAVTAGTGTVAPSLAFTSTTQQCGPVAFVRLRAVDAGAAGTIAAVLPALTAELDGQASTDGAVAVTLPALAADLDAAASTTGTVGATLPAIAASATATATADATLAATLPQIAVAATGAALGSGTAQIVLPALTAALAGQSEAAAGTVDATLPALDAALAGESETSGGVLDIVLPPMVGALSGEGASSGALAVELPALTAAFDGYSGADMYVPLCESWPLPDNCLEPVTGAPLMAASEVLWAMSGHQFGSCEVLLRPCRKSCAPAVTSGWWEGWEPGAWPQRWRPGEGGWLDAVCGRCSGGCDCGNADTLRLPAPAQSITQVLIDGVVLPEGSGWTLYDGTLLVRTDGERWPMCQDWTVPVSGTGAWSVTAVYGWPVPSMGQFAAAELATEIAAGCDQGECKLPAFTTSVSRQGVTQTFPSWIEVMRAGVIGVGLPMVDLFLRTENPSGLQDRPRIINPDDYAMSWRRPGGV